MTTAIKPRKNPQLVPLAKILEDTQEMIARNYYKTRLDMLVEPFDSRITFVVSHDFDGDTYVTNISPSDTVAGLNAAEQPVTSKELFTFLDEGTSVSYVIMPDDFDNETSPNSLDTRHVDYRRDQIMFSSEPGSGIAARNFLEQVDNILRNLYRLQMESSIKAYLNSL